MRASRIWLFAFLLITVAVEQLHASTPVLLFCAALALIPITWLIVQVTEQIASRTGNAVGVLLNAPFGNAPELIIGLVSLRAVLLDMVRASLIGVILADLLLALGLSFLGGQRHHVQKFNPTAARSSGWLSGIRRASVRSESLPASRPSGRPLPWKPLFWEGVVA